MRSAALAVVATLAVGHGCSCGSVAERIDPPDGAVRADAAEEAAVRPSPPPCVAWCEGVSLVATVDLRDRIERLDGFAFSPPAGAAVLLRRDGGDAGARHVIAIVDLANGSARMGDVADTMPLHHGISGTSFRATADGYVDDVAYPAVPVADHLGGTVALGRVTWDRDGSVAVTTPAINQLPTRLSPCTCDRPVAVSASDDGDLTLAAIIEGPSLLYGTTHGAATGETGTLLDLGASSPPGAAPISARLLGDGRAAIAWGGADPDLEPRPGGLALGRVGDPVWNVIGIAGAPFDPGPVVTRAGAGVAVVRFVTDVNDIGRSGIQLARYDESLAMLGTTVVPTRFGLEPRSMAVLESPNGPGVAFIEPGAARDMGELLVVAPSDGESCAAVETIPLEALDSTVELPIAAVWTGEEALVALVTTDRELRVYRTGTCHIEAREESH